LIAAAERGDGYGYADIPPGSVSEETEGELAALGYAIGDSERLWRGGLRIYTPESIAAGNFRLHVPRSVFTCVASEQARVPDAGDFNVEAILEERGDIPAN
jgi:hypothetical protein